MKMRAQERFVTDRTDCEFRLNFATFVLLALLLAVLGLSSCARYVSASPSLVDPSPSTPLVITTASVSAAVQNSSYSFALDAAGGAPPYTWAIRSGNVPLGLHLSAAGILSGTPTVVGSANFTVSVTDTAQKSTSQQLTMAVNVSGVSTTTGMLDTLTIFEVDGVTQANRPVTFGRVFQEGEIAGCPQPTIGGNPVNSYQADVKNRWPDGSVKFAVVSFTRTLGANSATEVAFQSTSSCNNSGYLTQGQMSDFNRGNWDAQIVVAAPGSTAVTSSAKAMLAASDPGANMFGDCKNDYWLQGPVVTAVIVQDCTSTSAYDFGWSWNGTAMSSPVTGNGSTASFHPMFILYFYPSSNAVEAEEIIELPWSGRVQDQLADLTFKTADAGGTLRTRWGHVGARKLTDITGEVITGDNIDIGVGREPYNTYNVLSSSANFGSSDLGLPFCVNDGTYWHCGVIQSVTDGSHATVRLPSDASSFSGSNLTAYIDIQAGFSRHRKVFWSGTAPGHIRVGHNFRYLKSTLAIPNYDPNVMAYPDHGYYTSGKCCGGWAYADWAGTDRGDIGGNDGWESAYSDVMEGAPLQRNDLLYLYNMDSGSCGNPNSACAKAWDMLTGETDANASTNLVGVAGGGGDWFNLGNVPFHVRESRTITSGGNQTAGNLFYCRTLENKNAATNTTTADCSGPGDGNVPDATGPNSATGKGLSRHAHSDSGFWPLPSVGTLMNTPGGWEIEEANYHWLDFAYLPYLLTGSPYYLEEEYFSASYQISAINPEVGATWTSNSFFGYVNPGGALVRTLAWSLQTIARAAYVAPDGSAEASYYLAMLNSNLEVQEGVMNLTDTVLTPLDTSCSVGSCSYNLLSANRWNWGRATVVSQCLQTSTSTCVTIAPALHFAAPGACPVVGSGANDVNAAVASTYGGMGFHYSYLSIVLSELREMGFASAASDDETIKSFEERVGDSTYNPYLIGVAYNGTKDISGGTTCITAENTDPYISSYSRFKLATAPSEQSAATFDASAFPGYTNFACVDHGYSLLARAATSFAQEFGTSAPDPNCPGGICTANATWDWVSAEVPYFTLVPGHSTPCSVWDDTYTTHTDWQIKFALAPR